MRIARRPPIIREDGSAAFRMVHRPGVLAARAGTSPGAGRIGSDWMEPDLYLDLARAMDRACFDYLVIEDGSFIADAFQGSPEWYLRHAYSVPKSDPVPLVPLLGQATNRLGIVAHDHHRVLPALPGSAAGRHPRPPDPWPGRVQPGDGAQRPLGAEFRPRPALRARSALRDGRRMDGGGQPAVEIVGAGRHRRRPARPAFSPTTPRSIRSTSRAGSTNRAARSTPLPGRSAVR